MSSIVVIVEVIAGTSELQTATEIAELATRLGVIVETSHNGVVMQAHPGDTREKVMRGFVRERGLFDPPEQT